MMLPEKGRKPVFITNIYELLGSFTDRMIHSDLLRKAFEPEQRFENPDGTAITFNRDYFGVVSGNREPKKFENSGLTASKSEVVDAPVINEFPICMECEFVEFQGDGYGCGVIGKVVRITADEQVMNGNTIDMSAVNAIAFDPYTHGYYKVTERVGEAFKDGLKLKK